MPGEIIRSAELMDQLPVHVTWQDYTYEGRRSNRRKIWAETFIIALDGQGYDDFEEHYDATPPATFSGEIEYGEDKQRGKYKYLAAGQVDVEPSFRGNHLAEKLSKALAYIAEQQGCSAITMRFVHPASLKIFRKIYGDDRIHFTKRDDFDGVQSLNISVDDAIDQINQERERVVKHGVYRQFGGGIAKHQPETVDEVLPGALTGVDAWIDIQGFDASGFDVPIQTGILPKHNTNQ